jgi:hypothetical protein
MRICEQCGTKLENIETKIDDKVYDISHRRFCLQCVPIHTTRQCLKCLRYFELYILTKNGRIDTHHRVQCLICLPYNDTNNKREPLLDYKLNDEQDQILNGHMLGDGYLSNGKKYKNSCFALKRKEEDYQYLLWSYNYFQELMTDKGIKKTCNLTGFGSFPQVSFFTRKLPIFTEYYNKWYPEGKKIVPKDLVLTPLTIAVWLADDGYIHIKRKNGRFSLCIGFCTQGFNEDDIIFLRDKLREKYGNKIHKCKASIGKSGDYLYTIQISNTYTSKKLLRDIDDIFPLDRKSNLWRNEEIDIYNKNIEKIKTISKEMGDNCIYCNGNNIMRRGHIKNKQRYFCKDCNKIYKNLEDYDELSKMPPEHRKILMSKYDIVI